MSLLTQYMSPSETASFETTHRTICSVTPQEFISPDNFKKLIEEGNVSINVHYIVVSNLELDNLTGLTSLPDKLTILGYLDLHNCTGLTALPERLSVMDCHLIDNCTGLTALSARLSVGGGNLDLTGCRGLSALPGRLSENRLL